MFPPRSRRRCASVPALQLAGILASVSWGFLARADYLQDVKPILTRHCVGCHGASQPKAGLRLDTAAALKHGGESHVDPLVAIAPNRTPPLLQILEGSHPTIARMPYKRPALTPAEIAVIQNWLNAGAPLPATEEPGRQIHWAFENPQRPAPPTAAGDSISHPIDRFVRAKLAGEHLTPSPEADRATLLRRLHLDLTGLPPTPSEVADFIADTRPDAYEQRVERLLHSPHHGERWARWWLDVARYADSNGYSIDAPRSMWPWRDWVIRAFNDDLPFDQFIVEQLAGDLLPDATLSQRIATGFHRNTQINQEGGIDVEQFRIESIIDRVNTVGTALLGLSFGCAQCHDHKFDPLTQREYFQVFAIFNNQDEPTLPVPTEEQRRNQERHEARLRELDSRLAALGKSTGPDTDPKALASERARLESERKKLEKNAPAVDSTLVLSERSEPRPAYVFIKGDFTRRGPDVRPGTPAALHPSHFPSNTRPTRLDFARWIVDPANPLTARVTVNRIWQQYFGRGLVETENDFGTQGAPPTHPELLDWLATELIAQRWSLRAIHRLIVTSATYRQASRHRPDLREIDANNRLLARQNRVRLDAEIIRDVALSASGTLNPIVGGPSVFPPQPDGVMNLGQVKRDWKPSGGADRYRRGLYTYFWRATPHPALAVFDAPDAFSACTRRLRSNTPLQALTLLNDVAFHELAGRLAERLQREAPANARLDLAFQLCLARPPRDSERQRLETLLRDETQAHGEAAAWQTVARVLLNLDETITRE